MKVNGQRFRLGGEKMSNRISRHKRKLYVDTLQNIPFEQLGSYLFDKHRLTTPVDIDNYVLKFCRKVSPNELPIYISVQPLSWSRQYYCNKNVERMIELNGGEMVFGYKIWYVPRLYIEGEKHAVWKNQKGELVDITFNGSGETKILFLPAPSLRNVVGRPCNKPRDSFNPIIKAFIEEQKKREQDLLIDTKSDDSWEGWERAKSYDTWRLQNHNLSGEDL